MTEGLMLFLGPLRCILAGIPGGHHTNQAHYKSGIMSPEYHEIKGVDGELWLRVKLEQADIHASIKPIYLGHFKLRQGRLASKKSDIPSNLTSFTCYRPVWPSAYLVLATTCTFQLSPN